MKFEMSKKPLVNALRRMTDVATKSIKADYDKAHRVSIYALKDRVVFATSNGHLNARWEVTDITDPELKIKEEGSVTVDVVRLRAIAQALGGKRDPLIEVFVDSKNSLVIRDTSAKKKQARIDTDAVKKHDEKISKPRSPKLTCTFTADNFRSGVASVGKYATKLGYKIRYKMLCLHFLKDSVRFVCGDGMRFGVLLQDGSVTNDVHDDGGVKYIMPIDQAEIISSVIEGASDITMHFKDAGNCYIEMNGIGLQLNLTGIPNEKYIAYEKHAFRSEEAKDIIDVQAEELREAMALVEAVRNKEAENEGKFHTFSFSGEEDGHLDLRVYEGRLQCDFQFEDIFFYNLKDNPAFKSEYAFLYMDDLAKASNGHSYVRFFCIDEAATIIAESIDVDENEKENGIPLRKVDDSNRVVFFFAAVTDDADADG